MVGGGADRVDGAPGRARSARGRRRRRPPRRRRARGSRPAPSAAAADVEGACRRPSAPGRKAGTIAIASGDDDERATSAGAVRRPTAHGLPARKRQQVPTSSTARPARLAERRLGAAVAVGDSVEEAAVGTCPLLARHLLGADRWRRGDPPRSTCTVLHASIASSRRWVETSTRRRGRGRRLTTSKVASTPIGSTPSNGSSSRSTCGLVHGGEDDARAAGPCRARSRRSRGARRRRARSAPGGRGRAPPSRSSAAGGR